MTQNKKKFDQAAVFFIDRNFVKVEYLLKIEPVCAKKTNFSFFSRRKFRLVY